jgi:hypothetical protein
MIVAEAVSPVLAPWSSFYLMTSSSAAALTGLMFIVITLVTGTERARKSPDGISTFSTPTVVHFCSALLVSAILSAPWHALVSLAVVLGTASLGGVVYVLHVMHRTRQLRSYTPDLEDWAWYTISPLGAYVTLLAGALLLITVPANALFVLAGGVMLLIFIGIRNAWDVVTYIAISSPGSPSDSS